MPLFNEGRSSDTAASIRNGASMRRLREALAKTRFPVSKRELVESMGDLRVETGSGQPVALADVLRGVNANEFTSADHVAEVARLAWSLPTELHPPEGSG